jgi:hypothetical protein
VALIGIGAIGIWGGLGGADDVEPAPVGGSELAPDAVPAAARAEPAAARAASAAAPDDADSDASGDVVARVPLFGPTSLGEAPEPDDSAADDESEASEPARARVADESFADAERSRPAQSRSKERHSATEFSRGRLHLPIVYRLRLDEPGERLVGERTANGFDVTIPGRKTMESGAAIARRDDRIAKVVTRNADGDTRVSFRFHGSIPPYKVRLRKDFVEFFISSR